jgi:hypothetical protein
MMVIGLHATMPRRTLYRYPFDNEGREVLTLAESIAAMQELEHQINQLCAFDWRWCDLRLSVVERHPTYVVYEVHHRDEYTGQAIVMPCASPSGMKGLRVTVSDWVLFTKIRVRLRSKTTS